jgi:hypothetical protein
VNPGKQDVFLQLRVPGGPDVLCAKLPADHFMRMHGSFKFWDKHHRVGSAKGLDDMTLRVFKNGSVRLRTFGRRVQLQVPHATDLQMTIGFQDPVSGASVGCSPHLQTFRTRGGRLIAP